MAETRNSDPAIGLADAAAIEPTYGSMGASYWTGIGGHSYDGAAPRHSTGHPACTFASLATIFGALTDARSRAPAMAQADYPMKPVHIVVPQSPGSGGDVVARLLADRLQAELKQTFVIENKAGANGIVAAAALAKEAADGYTLMLAGVSQISLQPAPVQEHGLRRVQGLQLRGAGRRHALRAGGQQAKRHQGSGRLCCNARAASRSRSTSPAPGRATRRTCRWR